jgi:sugar phosphate isomerase/epimerase
MLRHEPDRRQFLQASAAGLLALGVSLEGMQAARPMPLQISLAQWSLHRSLRSGDLAHLDFAKVTKRDYGLDAVEYVNSFFKDHVSQAGYVADMKKRADDEGVRSLLIMVDGEGAIGDADAKKQTKAIEAHRKWLDAAKELGCHSIRVNAQSSGTWTEQRDRAADGLHRLSQLGDALGLHVLVENHGGLSSNGRWLAETIRKANHPRCGTLPDFGNFRVRGEEWYDRYVGMADLLPYAKAVSAKSHEFDDTGREVNTDFLRVMKLVMESGYRGYVGIEYEGSKHTEKEGILLTKQLLLRTIEDLKPK